MDFTRATQLELEALHSIHAAAGLMWHEALEARQEAFAAWADDPSVETFTARNLAEAREQALWAMSTRISELIQEAYDAMIKELQS